MVRRGRIGERLLNAPRVVLHTGLRCRLRLHLIFNRRLQRGQRLDVAQVLLHVLRQIGVKHALRGLVERLQLQVLVEYQNAG